MTLATLHAMLIGSPSAPPPPPALDVTASPTSLSGSGNGIGQQLVVTGSTTATATGGAGGYTYVWTANPTGLTINSPNSATTSFQKNMLAGSSYSGVATVTATDSLGASKTADVSVDLVN